MRNLRDLIEDQETNSITLKDEIINDVVEVDEIEETKEKINKVKKQVVNSELEFSDIYTNKELYDLALRINDSFLMNLKSDQKITKESLEEVLPEFISSFNNEVRTLKREHLDDIKELVINNIVGYGHISTIFNLAKDGLNDVIVNTKDYIDIIYKGKTEETPFSFRSEDELRKIIDKMLAENNRKIDEAHPIISSKLNDGSRVEVQIPPIAANDGSCVTIRKFNEIPLLLEMLIDSGQMDMKMAYFLVKAAKGKCNIIVSGGTSSGKTTFLNALTRFVDGNEQLMVIEDTKEMQPQMPCHSIRSYEARMPNEEGKGAITLDYLLRSALRSSPRRIIVGECRGPEIVVMLNAMNTGHPGSMTTVHADNTKEALVRIENMYLEARPSANINFIRTQMVSAIDVIIQLVRFPDGTRKLITVSEIERRMEDNGVVALNNVFEFKRDTSDMKKTKGEFQTLATPTRTIDQMNMFGVDIDKRVFDPNFDMPKSMLIEALETDLPSVMCGWKDEYLDVFLDRDSQLLHKWPHFQKMRKE
ncbi:CpaF family protein [Poseidonibacter lekithochrous]|uniref:CpaF family protein n=1 Tax=Poseidonibacter lekithochrous TaxID=1904463 RepID=UPI0008FC25D3|nr:ATPase, T2SS/T4P/T4SS family [Poseidonibacter lekithochrous]QKJ24328.1 Flp pilus assembly protein, TadA family ATPase [Poseidonibacter lekithochrous]